MQSALPPQEPAAAASTTEARRHHQHKDPVPLVHSRRVRRCDQVLLGQKKGTVLKKTFLTLAIIDADLYNHQKCSATLCLLDGKRKKQIGCICHSTRVFSICERGANYGVLVTLYRYNIYIYMNIY